MGAQRAVASNLITFGACVIGFQYTHFRNWEKRKKSIQTQTKWRREKLFFFILPLLPHIFFLSSELPKSSYRISSQEKEMRAVNALSQVSVCFVRIVRNVICLINGVKESSQHIWYRVISQWQSASSLAIANGWMLDFVILTHTLNRT